MNLEKEDNRREDFCLNRNFYYQYKGFENIWLCYELKYL
jgi:hypothetical protein